jgi:hypothetical protein
MNQTAKGQPIIERTLTWRLLDDDAVIVSPRSGKIRVLNHSGALTWQLLAAGKSLAEMADVLAERYEISREQAYLDLEAFLDDLSQRGMVLWEPTAS